MEVRGTAEIKMFCKDFVEHAEVMFVFATLASLLVIISLVHYLMALSANHAHIRGQEKFNELLDLQDLNSEIMAMNAEKENYKWDELLWKTMCFGNRNEHVTLWLVLVPHFQT